MNVIRSFLVLVLAIACAPGVARSASTVRAAGNSTDQDAVQKDPAATLQPPASMAELAILSHGARINGLMYLAAGSGPHAIVIFLHGYPGNEPDSILRKLYGAPATMRSSLTIEVSLGRVVRFPKSTAWRMWREFWLGSGHLKPSRSTTSIRHE